MRFSIPAGGRLPADNMGGTWVRVEDAALPRPLYLRVGSEKDGRLVCTGLVVDSEPDRELTARALRKIPLSGILTSLAGTREQPIRMSPPLRELLGQQSARRARPGRRGYPDKHYRQVAKAYRLAKGQHPRAPIRALMGELHVSEPTVHRWLRTARERGFLKDDREEQR